MNYRIHSAMYSGMHVAMNNTMQNNHICSLVPFHPTCPPGHIPVEDLVAGIVAADVDKQLLFQVEEAVAAKQQLGTLKIWEMANSSGTTPGPLCTWSRSAPSKMFSLSS